MDTRAVSSPTGASATRERGTTWVVSRHLLVAQAVSAALASVGVPVRAASWDTAWDTEPPGVEATTDEDVVVILDDVESPEAIEEITRFAATAESRMVVVTSHPPDIWWGGLVESEAVEVVSMAVSVEQLADLVTRFAAGETLMEPECRDSLRLRWSEAQQRRRRLVALMSTLSPKEQHVLELLASGCRVTEIGTMMGLSSSTVRSHVKSLRAKLGAETQLGAVAMLIQLREAGMSTPLVPRPRASPG